MRNPMMTMSIRLFALMGLMPVLAADLKTFQETYQTNSEEILQSYQPQFAALQQQYKKSLEALKALVQSQGDLAKTKAAIAEIERFQKEKSLPATLDENGLQEIKAFQVSYVKQYAKLETDLTVKLGTLTTKYERELDRLQKEMVKAGKLDEATAVLAEREKAQRAIKGYADQLSALREPSATNKTGVATAAALPARPVPGAGGVSANKRDLYLVVDLAGGEKAKSWPVSYLAGEPKGGWSDEYKTDKLLLRRIEPGTFDMGSPEDEPGRDSGETQHKVTLTKPFYIGVFEVTQRQWELVMGSTPSAFKANSDMCPVEQVSYLDIRENPDNSDDPAVDWPVNSTVNTKSFMGKLRARTGKAFDLPTEAQWEYACRAGTTGAYAGKGGLDNQAWYQDNASGKTHPVGQKGANAWGLYDMHGNVWEWCLDWLGTYPGTVSDPKGASPGSFRVDRGGSWDYYAGYCRTANRDGSNPDRRRSHVGFRAVVPAGQ